MSKNRLEAFSDGVIAIIITIMVLEMKVPHGVEVGTLAPLLPVFLSYILSFVYLGIYWNNHHHLLQAAKHVNGKVMWANLHLLFWLSLIPFASGWMGENHFATVPVVLYGGILFACATAYLILAKTLVSTHCTSSTIHKAISNDKKERISIGLYAAALLVCAWVPWLTLGLYTVVAIMWIIPDPRIERALNESRVAE